MSEDRPSVERMIAAANARAAANRREGARTGLPFRARGRTVRRKPGEMNKTERRYADRLEAMKMDGKILEWRYEAVKLRLADLSFWTADFLVLDADGYIELHEVKTTWRTSRGPKPGFREDARLKVRFAAETYPWFRIVTAVLLLDGSWKMEEYGQGKEKEIKEP